MFYRYISGNLTDYINQREAKVGQPGYDFAAMSDEDAEQLRKAMVA